MSLHALGIKIHGNYLWVELPDQASHAEHGGRLYAVHVAIASMIERASTMVPADPSFNKEKP